MHRREFLGAALIAASSASCVRRGEHDPAVLEEITISTLASGLHSGKWTSRQLADMYLSRIGSIDKAGPKTNAVIEINPDAMAMADALDAELRSKGPRGPLHGVPIFLKDNIDTADRMMTTAGSLALYGWHAPKDSDVAATLRKAGALFLGKTNLSEWANFRSSRSVSGWSGRGGQTRNPYSLDRNPSGSSSGSGVAVSASLCAAAVGTETDGSVVSPSSANGIVGVKPTVGLIGGRGIIPIAHSQDTAGPMARTVRDAAILLTALSNNKEDYAKQLDPRALKGARIGVMRKFFENRIVVDRFLTHCVEALKSAGAEVIDPVVLPSHGKWGQSEFQVLLYEFKHDLNAYLSGVSTKVKSIEDLIKFNEENRSREMPYFEQETLIEAQKKGGLDSKEYIEARENCVKLTRAEGIDAVLAEHKLDALVAPTSGPAWRIDWVNGDSSSGGTSSVAAVSGYPSITVPAGFIGGLPVGLSFTGAAWTEAKLLRYAYSFEQLTQARKKPKYLPGGERPDQA